MTLLPKGKKAHYAIFSFKYFVNDYPPYCTLYSMQCTAFFLTKNIVSKGFFWKNGLVMFFPLHISVIVIFLYFYLKCSAFKTSENVR